MSYREFGTQAAVVFPASRRDRSGSNLSNTDTSAIPMVPASATASATASAALSKEQLGGIVVDVDSNSALTTATPAPSVPASETSAPLGRYYFLITL